MELILKERKQFPNWPLALEFLKRSPMHFLVTDALPPEEPEEALAAQIILRNSRAKVPYLSVPDDFSTTEITAICSALTHLQLTSGQPSFGSVESSNFVMFMKEFTQILSGKFELDEVAQAITDKTCELFGADGASILIPTEDQSQFRFAFLTTATEDIRKRLENILVPADKGVTGWVAQNQRSILINDVNRDLIFNPDIDKRTHFRTREIMATPISTGKRMIGILQIVNKQQGKFEKSDLQIVELIASIIAFFIEKAQLYSSKIIYAKVQKELEIASEMQTSFMPSLPAQIGPFRLVGQSRQVSRVGGDFWDILNINPGEKLLLLGDVSGHGLGASLIMSAVRTACRAILPHLQTTKELIEPLNRLIYEEFGVNRHYATLIFCTIDTVKRRICYFRAGHEYPILRSGGTVQRLKEVGGLPIGLLPFRLNDPWYEFQFEPGDCLYLYTDGVVDGFKDPGLSILDVISENPRLGTLLEDGALFSTLRKKYHWTHYDDATLLKLMLA